MWAALRTTYYDGSDEQLVEQVMMKASVGLGRAAESNADAFIAKFCT